VVRIAVPPAFIRPGLGGQIYRWLVDISGRVSIAIQALPLRKLTVNCDDQVILLAVA
jgi:hypothetical protein